MSCTITLDGLALHRYTKGLVGWGERSSITGERGELVTFDTLDQAQRWIASNGQFSRGAQACGLEAPTTQSSKGDSMTVIYQHPEGMGQIEFNAQTQHLVIRNDETNEVAHAVIGPEGLRELAAELLKLADKQ